VIYVIARTIFFEIKILLKSTNAKIAVVLNCLLIAFFIIANMISLRDIKEMDISRFEHLSKLYASSAISFRDSAQFYLNSAETETNPDWRKMNELLLESALWSSEYCEKVSSISQELHENLKLGNYREAQVLYHQFIVARHDNDLFLSQERFTNAFGHPSKPYGIDMGELYAGNSMFYGDLVQRDIPPLYDNDMKPFNFMYQIFQKALPLYFFIISLLVIMKALSGEAESGSLTFTLTKPLSRTRLFFAKYIAATAACLIVILLPILASAVILGIVNGVDSPRYPVLAQSNAYTSTLPLSNDQLRLEQIYSQMPTAPETISSAFSTLAGRFGISSFDFYGIGGVFPGSGGMADEPLEFISIAKFLLGTVPLWIASAILFVSIIFILALLLRKSLLVFVVAVPLAAVNLIFGLPAENLSRPFDLNPFLAANAGQILSGTGSVTALHALMVSLVIAVFCTCVSAFLFKRLEIK
jgi:ABC-type transport system involved in multi-copper enzyme maturation permease subunit